MAESLPVSRALYKKTTDPDNAWVEAVDGEFQAEPGIEYEICCVGPSSVAKKTWNPAIPLNALFTEDGFALVTEDGLYLTTEA